MQVLIYRHQLFKISEPFIVQQASQFRKFRPVFIGRDRFNTAPFDYRTLVIDDLQEQQAFSRKLWQVITRDPTPYLQLLKDDKPFLLHAHFGVEGVYALPISRKLGIPLITTFHGFDATTSVNGLIKSGSISWINYALFRHQLAKEGSLFLCVSNYIRERVINLGFPEERTQLHYIGIDTKSILPRHPSEETSIILHVARLVEKKGTEYLIRAFSKIASHHPQFDLVIIGDGPLKVELESLVRSLELVERVHFLGEQSHQEVMSKMKSAAMLVLPSVTAKTGDAEGLGMVLLEAAALGIPLIGSNHGGIPEVVEDGKTGFLVAERDVAMLAKRISDLLNDHNLRKKLGNQARKLIELRFDIHKQTEKLELIYKSLLP